MIQCIAMDKKNVSINTIIKHIKKIPHLQLIKTINDSMTGSDSMKRNVIQIVFMENQLSQHFDVKHDFFFAHANGCKMKINFKDIAYVESAGNYVLLIGDNLKIMLYKSISTIQQILSKELFIRVHKSYIVSIEHIDSIKGNSCILTISDKEICIPIGITFRQEIFKKLRVV